MENYSYVGVGKVSLRVVGENAGLIEVGNCSALNFAVTESSIELKDFTQGGGGLYNEVKRVDSVEAQMTLHDLSPSNLAMALYGSYTAIAEGVVSGEAVTAYPGAVVKFANMPKTTVAPTVAPTNAAATARANTTPYALNAYATPATPNDRYYKATTAGTSGGTVPTWPTTIGDTVTDGTVVWTCAGKTTLVADTDYQVRAAGLLVSEGATLAGESWTVGYTKAAANLVQALTSSGKEYELLFEGLNEAKSGKRTIVNAYKVKVGAAQNLGLIGEEFAALELTGKVIKDTTKTGAGISQYFSTQVEV